MVRVSKNIEYIKDKVGKIFIKTNSIVTDNNVSLDKLCDFIVEQGVTGIWTYRKWNSGIMELFCSVETNKFNLTSGSFKEYSLQFPFKFIEVPCVLIGTPTSASSGHYGITDGRVSELSTSSCRLTHGAGSLPFIWISAHFIGRWK